MIGRPGLSAVLLPFAILACVLLAAPARAADPVVTTRELGSWVDALAALRGDLGSEGRTLHVSVRSGGARVPCEHYRLTLDEAAQAAFRVGACDDATDETELSLEHRTGLFDHDSYVPRPRTLSITAAVTYQGTAVAGGGAPGGSALRCAWAVRPYLDDQEHGTRVLLTPEHYLLRSGAAWVAATPEGAGWSLSTTERESFHLEYEVVDKATGDVVLRQKMTLACGPEGASSPAAPVVPAPEPAARPRPDVEPSRSRPERLPASWPWPTGAEPRKRARKPVVRSPMMRPMAIVMGIFHAAFVTAQVGLWSASAVTRDAGTRSGEQIVGSVGIAPAVLSGLFAGLSVWSMYDVPKHPPMRARLSVPERGAGATMDLSLAF